MNWKTSHTMIIGALLVALGTQLAGLEHGFQDALTPAFIGGLLVQIGTTVGAMLIGSPLPPPKWDRIERRAPEGVGAAVTPFPHSGNRS